MRCDTPENHHLPVGMSTFVTHVGTRNKLDSPPEFCHMLFLEPGSLVMERKMLTEIKKRAERLAVRREAEMPAR